MAKLSRGIQAMVVASVAFSTMAMLVKLASPHIPNQEIVALRSLASILPIFALMKWRGVSFKANRPGLLFLRGTFGYIAITCWFVSLKELDLADAVMIQYTSPVFVALLAPLVLKEPSEGKHRAALAVALAGVILVVRPGFGLSALGALIGLTGALSSACGYLTVRALSRHETPLLLIISFPTVASVLSLGGSFGRWVMPDMEGWILIAGIGLMTIIGQIFLTFGLMSERAGPATVATYSAVVVSVLMGIFVFGQWPDLWMMLGGGLVAGAVVSLAVSKSRPAPPPAGAGASRNMPDAGQAAELARLSRIG